MQTTYSDSQRTIGTQDKREKAMGIFIVITITIILLAIEKIKDTPVTSQRNNYRITPNNRYNVNSAGTINEETTDTEYIKNAYTPKWLFSYNEKDTYYKINKIAQRNGLKVFAKVRLLDLVTPINNHPKFKTNLWKVQAKHVDFVLTTESLVAKYIIELDDISHDTQDRKQRDKFVDTVLTTCGYKVLHIRGVKEEEIQAFINKDAPRS